MTTGTWGQGLLWPGGLVSSDADVCSHFPPQLRWKNFAQGWPRCLNVDSIFELDSNIQFSRIRANNFTGFLIFQ